MAAVPYDPAPSVPAEEQQPNDQIRVEASPASFGAPVAQGLEQAGAGALDASKFYGQVAADHATNNYLDARTKILYGDPSQPMLDAQGNPVMGPDGKPMPDTGFYGRRGADALAAAPAAQAALAEAAQDQATGLSTPASREAFENQSRRFRASDMASMGQHVDQQQRTWATDTNNTAATLATNDIAINAADDTASAAAAQRYIAARVKNAQLAGEDPAGAVLKAQQDIDLTRIRALSTPQAGAAGAEKAAQIYNNSRVLQSLPNYDQIGKMIKDGQINAEFSPAVDQEVQTAVASAQQSVSGTPPAPGAAAGPSDYLAQVHLHEGTAPDPNSSAQRGWLAPTWVSFLKSNPQFSGAIQGMSDQQIAGLRATNPALVDQATVLLAQQNAKALPAGVPPTNGNLFAMQWFGPGNGPKVLSAPPDTPIESVIGADAAAKNRLTGQTTGQVVANINHQFGDGAYAGPGSTSNATDALRLAMPSILENTHAHAEARWPTFPDVQDRYVQTVRNRLDQFITQQDQMYLVDTHTIQAASAGALSDDDIAAKSPAAAAALERLKGENPMYYNSLQSSVYPANAKGVMSHYGGGFKDYLDDVLAPSTSPNRVASPAQLWPHVGAGTDAALTNSGADQLSQLLSIRGNAKGEADAAQIKAFVDQWHGQITFSNKGTGVYDQKGEALYSKFLASMLPVIMRAQKDGTLGDVLNPQSKNYLGNMATTVMRPPAELLRDKLEFDNPEPANGGPPIQHPLLRGPAYTVQSLGAELNSLENDRQRTEFWTDAVKAGRISPQVSAAYRQSLQTGPRRPTGGGAGPAPPGGGDVRLPPLVSP